MKEEGRVSGWEGNNRLEGEGEGNNRLGGEGEGNGKVTEQKEGGGWGGWQGGHVSRGGTK